MMRNWLGITRILVMICLSVFVVESGCSRTDSQSSQSGSNRPSFLIGLVPEQSMFKQIERYQPLVHYLSERTGFEVRLTVLSTYQSILTGFISEKMDAAFFGSFSYILAHQKLGVQSIARPVGLNGKSTYHGLIFVRKDSRIRSINDMRGKRFAFASKDTTAGYLLPLAYFRQARVDYKTYFTETYFTGTHEDAIRDVLDRKADVGAAKSTEFDRLAADDPRIRTDLLILAKSPEMPENSLAVRRGIDPVLVEKLKAVLFAMDQDPEGARILQQFGAHRFIETAESDFKPVYEYARSAGFNIRMSPD